MKNKNCKLPSYQNLSPNGQNFIQATQRELIHKRILGKQNRKKKPQEKIVNKQYKLL